jgi:hypothetical protein
MREAPDPRSEWTANDDLRAGCMNTACAPGVFVVAILCDNCFL